MKCSISPCDSSPPSRFLIMMSQMLIGLTRFRIASVTGWIHDLTAGTRYYSTGFVVDDLTTALDAAGALRYHRSALPERGAGTQRFMSCARPVERRPGFDRFLLRIRTPDSTTRASRHRRRPGRFRSGLAGSSAGPAGDTLRNASHALDPGSRDRPDGRAGLLEQPGL